jgi:type I restriction enzyme R subunit
VSTYNIIASSDESTVVAEYIPDLRSATDYQSEADLEREFINNLVQQGYEYLPITTESALLANLRRQLEVLNHISFTGDEWQRFCTEVIANPNDGIVEKTRKIQTDHIQAFRLSDGSTQNIMLIDKKSIHNNRLQVINQYESSGGARQARYDVTILVNGLPLVHIELKRRGVAIREAFNQINRYQRDSFWAAAGLYEFIQIFVISNGTHTKYYSNTTRDSQVREQSSSERRRSKKTSNSFEFTSFWADASNQVIPDLVDFTKTFFARHTLLNILTRFCVFTADDLLLVMRPYQIAATERVLRRIVVSTNYKQTGKTEAGGYIWHTTGSGKTLTSFKTAQLATGLESIQKVLFVVDRKDLDYQTMKEYDRFEKGAANSNTSTRVLQRQLEDPNVQIIITTIQKLDLFIGRNREHPIYRQHVVIIFDECHRSQFGEMHRRITRSFRNYHLFGFTGTPIFVANAAVFGGAFATGANPLIRTTEQAFGEQLHTYTIVDAIRDGNVLPFRIDYVDSVGIASDIIDKQVPAIDIEKAFAAPERISKVVSYVLEHFDQKTKRGPGYSYMHKGRRVDGFNSIMAVSSIPMAMQYYAEFRRQLADNESSRQKLNIATIYSFSVNEDDPESGLPDEDFDNSRLDQSSRDFLEAAIADYNAVFSTNYSTSADGFQNYYSDVSTRVKNREVDLLIVVNMFLTGFDATTLNTLWVDKNLRSHGLIQAFSRTNRILNSVKTYGNIVCFRNLLKATEEAIALFGDREVGGAVLLRPYQDYYLGYMLGGEDGQPGYMLGGEDGQPGIWQPGYVELVDELLRDFPLGELVESEQAQRVFVRLYGAILRLRNILTAFDEFEGNEILSLRELQDYQSEYLRIYDILRGSLTVDKENINDDLVFELELIKQIEVNIDYILMLVESFHDSNCEDRNVLVAIDKAIASSLELRSKRELIERFVAQVSVSTVVDRDWTEYVQARREEDLATLIAAQRLREAETRRFIETAFRDGVLKTTGTDLDNLLPPISLFAGIGEGGEYRRLIIKQAVIDLMQAFFEKYFGLV